MASLAFVSGLAVPLWAQTVTVNRLGDVVAVQAPGLGFIKGEPLARLKDGRTVRVDLDLAVLPGPGGAAAARGRQTYLLSYDLWEERFAVTRVGTPARSAAYLTTAGAEAWCLEQLTIAVSALGRLARDAPFWIRLEYRILDDGTARGTDDGSSYSLQGLIESLSRRRKAHEWTNAIEAGPFRLRP